MDSAGGAQLCLQALYGAVMGYLLSTRGRCYSAHILALSEVVLFGQIRRIGGRVDSQQIIGYVYFSLIMVGAALMLFCVATIHRSPYFTEVQKLKWLLFVLILPYFGPLAWILRVRRERAEAAASQAVSEGSTDPTNTK